MNRETEKFIVTHVSSSYDLRTNVWSMKCKKCGRRFTPSTTMFARQTVSCPNKNCNQQETINYNELH
jgi:uncharacterized OB-fold protein